MKPRISVLMGVRYVRQETGTLKRAVDSILAQTCGDFELLICDDGSAAEAREWLEALAGSEARVRLIRPGNCLDLSSKLNACMREAAGAYYARMDDDDYSHPDRFEKQLAFLDAHPEIAFVGSLVDQCRAGEHIGIRRLPEFPTVRDFYMTQPFVHPALLFRAEALKKAGGYSEDRRCFLCEDYDLLLRLYHLGFQGANMQEVLFDYTVSAKAKANRKMIHRWNEAVTRWRRFGEAGRLPEALPYVVKPLAVGLLPERVLAALKARR